jgi:hypothetical protein
MTAKYRATAKAGRQPWFRNRYHTKSRNRKVSADGKVHRVQGALQRWILKRRGELNVPKGFSLISGQYLISAKGNPGSLFHKVE